MAALCAVAGGSTVQRLTFPIPLPNAVFVFTFPGPRFVVIVNGTTDNRQHLMSAIGSLIRGQAPWPGRVNTFFSTAASVITARVLATIGPLNPVEIVFVGHSLGGAVAQLLACLAWPWPCSGVWTIGQPRVGDAGFAAAWSTPADRYTSAGDPVPMLPPNVNALMNQSLFNIWPQQLLSYQHVGQRFHLYPTGRIEELPEAPTWDEANAYLVSAATSSTGWIGAHDSKRYACRIRRGIPVPWRTVDPEWPGLKQVDDIYTTFIGTPTGRCADEINTDTGANENAGPVLARQGLCQ